MVNFCAYITLNPGELRMGCANCRKPSVRLNLNKLPLSASLKLRSFKQVKGVQG